MGGTFYKKRSKFLGFIPKTTTRPKTFKTEEAAKLYADNLGMKDYKLENLKSTESSTKKIRIVV